MNSSTSQPEVFASQQVRGVSPKQRPWTSQLEIVAAFTRVAESLSIDDFFAEEAANADGWQSASLPWSVTGDALPDDLSIRLLSVFDPPLQVDGHVVRFTFAGSFVKLPAAYEPAIRFLFQLNACTLNEVVEASGVPRRSAESLVRRLQSLGLIELGNRAEERPA